MFCSSMLSLKVLCMLCTANSTCTYSEHTDQFMCHSSVPAFVQVWSLERGKFDEIGKSGEKGKFRKNLLVVGENSNYEMLSHWPFLPHLLFSWKSPLFTPFFISFEFSTNFCWIFTVVCISWPNHFCSFGLITYRFFFFSFSKCIC